MARTYWPAAIGVLVVLVPLALALLIKRFDLLAPRPDARITYSGAAGAQRQLHAFFARDRAAAPAVLLFHGGGWRYGSPQQFYPQCRFLAKQGYSCFSAEYTLGDANGPDIPGAVADARAAFAHLTAHARELGIDPARIAAGGGSAGGQLAAMLGVNVAPDRPAPLALLLYNPILDLSPGALWHDLAADAWPAVSPLHQSAASYPPTLILVGSVDDEVPLSIVDAFCAAAQAAGNRCDSEVYEGLGHGFFNDEPYLTQTSERVLAFLERVTR